MSEFTGDSRSSGMSSFSGDSWSDSESESESESVTEFPVLVPKLGEQLSSRCYSSLEEQLYQLLAMAYGQARRQAMVRLVGQKEPVAIETPFVRPIKPNERQMDRQLALSRKTVNWYMPVKEADALVLERKKEFLKLGCPQETITVPRFKTGATDAVPIVDVPVEAMTVQAESSDATMEENKPLPMPDTTHLTDSKIKYGNTELQPRDIEMLADLYESRFITIRHAALLHFAGLKSGEASAKRRLSLLEKAGLLTKQAVNLEKYKTIYTFNKTALDALVACGVLPQITGDEWDSKLRKRFSGISQSTIEHEIGMLEIKAALTPAIKEMAHLKLVELGIWPQAYEFQYQSGGKFPVLRPDGFLAVAAFQPNKTDAKHTFFYLELDRGTENHEALVEKMVAYRYHLRQGGFRKWIGAADGQPETSFRVLFVFDTAMARQRIFNACLAFTEAKIETLAMMTSLDALVKDPLGAIWLTPIAHHHWLEAGRTGQPKLEALL